MDLQAELLTLDIKKDTLIVVRFDKDIPVASRSRDAIQRISDKLEATLGFRPTIISCTNETKFETLDDATLASIGLQRIPTGLGNVQPLASPVPPAKLKEWEDALRKVKAGESVHGGSSEPQREPVYGEAPSTEESPSKAE